MLFIGKGYRWSPTKLRRRERKERKEKNQNGTPNYSFIAYIKKRVLRLSRQLLKDDCSAI